jgi:hypothetical protein
LLGEIHLLSRGILNCSWRFVSAGRVLNRWARFLSSRLAGNCQSLAEISLGWPGNIFVKKSEERGDEIPALSIHRSLGITPRAKRVNLHLLHPRLQVLIRAILMVARSVMDCWMEVIVLKRLELKRQTLRTQILAKKAGREIDLD